MIIDIAGRMRLSFIRNEWVGYIRRYNALNLLGRGRLLTRYWFKQGKFLIMNLYRRIK